MKHSIRHSHDPGLSATTSQQDWQPQVVRIRQLRRRRRSPQASMAVAEAGTARLTKQNLVDYLASGCKPHSAYRCDAALRSLPRRRAQPYVTPPARRLYWKCARSQRAGDKAVTAQACNDAHWCAI